MTGSRAPIQDVADSVVRIDVAVQTIVGRPQKSEERRTAMAIRPWTQPGPTTRVATGGGIGLRTIAAIGAAAAVMVSGIVTGYVISTGGDAPSPTTAVAPPTPTATPTPTTVLATPDQPTPPPTPTPTAGSPAPTISLPPPTVTAPPIAFDDEPQQFFDDGATGYGDPEDDLGSEDPDEPRVAAAGSTELLGGYVASAGLSRRDVASIQEMAVGRAELAVIEDLWPCTDVNVFCGPGQLEPGDYFFIGFASSEPLAAPGDAQVYQVYYVMTDLDGDWTNNGFVTPPRVNNIYASSQYVIEAGWYGATKGLGETDFRGPIGPDGQTPRYNQTPASRLVVTDDPPGGFFIIPQDRIGDWMRIASMWRDFSQERAIAVDWVTPSAGLALIPVPGRSEPPSTLQCASVAVVAEALGDHPAHLRGVFRLQPDASLPAGAVASMSLLSGTLPDAETVDYPDLELEDLGGGAFAFRVGVPVQMQHGIAELVVRAPGGPPVHLTDEFVVLAGSGVNVADGFDGHALGDPTCEG